MTINLGQFGGVFWHDENGNEQEVIGKGNTGPVQGMLFHPLTGTGIPGDPMQTSAGRELDVRNAFGYSFPDVERSGIPRDLLGTQDNNPSLRVMDGRRKTASGSYDPTTNTISLRPEGHVMQGAESAIHELGHSRDRDRLKEIGSRRGYIPEAEGLADGFQDRFSSENIMKPSSDFDPLINPDRSSEIMKEPIEKLDSNTYRLMGYGGNSTVWRDKVDQATYSINRLLGSMRSSGLPAHRPPLTNTVWGDAKDLSDLQLTKKQQRELDIGKEVTPGMFIYNDRSDSTSARTLRIGRLYKFNPHVKKFMDESGMQDLGEFASHVHTAYRMEKASSAWKARNEGRIYGSSYDAGRLNPDTYERTKKEIESASGGTLPTDTRSKNRVKTLLQPSLFEDDAEAMKLIDPKPPVFGTDTGDAYFYGMASIAKAKKIKKPKKREKSEWDVLKDSYK